MARQWLLFVCGLGMLTSCFDPRYPEGIPCSEAQTCPPGQSCDIDGVCRATLLAPLDPDAAAPPDAAARPDAAVVIPDAAVPDALVPDATVVPPSCKDGMTNGDETSLDCGGSCPACADGQACRGHGDCASQVCDPVDLLCAPAECGDARVGGNEACDLGGVNTGTCDSDCTAPACADGVFNQFVEVCDTGGVATADCDPDCTFPQCNDGFFNDLAEICDESGNTATCDADCSEPACGDRFINPAVNEECDQGGVANTICDLDCTFPQCNDGQFNPAAGEDADPPASPSRTVPVSDLTCRYDFSGINQLSCAGTCGAWGGGDGCQQADADAFCKLKTGNPNSTASNFVVGLATATPGICCPTVDPYVTGCVPLGSFANRGVTQPVSVHDTSLSSTHGRGAVITDVVCTNP
jgi:hypothetical protein